jgi:hypothetical protein
VQPAVQRAKVTLLRGFSLVRILAANRPCPVTRPIPRESGETHGNTATTTKYSRLNRANSRIAQSLYRSWYISTRLQGVGAVCGLAAFPGRLVPWGAEPGLINGRVLT